MPLITVAAGQAIKATHVSQFTRWVQGTTKDQSATFTTTHASQYTLTLTNEVATGNILKLGYGTGTAVAATFSATSAGFSVPTTFTGVNSTTYAMTLQNSHTEGKAFQINDATGTSMLAVHRTTSGNDIVVLAKGAGTGSPDTSRLIVITTNSTLNYVNADFQMDVSGTATAVDSGAIRGIAFQHSGTGAGFIRGGEFHTRRKSPAGSGQTWGIEVGVHSEISHANDHGIVGVFIANSSSGWLSATGVRANTGLLIDGASGWNNPILVRDTDSSTTLFRHAGLTTGNDLKGDVQIAGRVYSHQQLGTTYWIGNVDHNAAHTGATFAGYWFDATAGRLALHIAAASAGSAYHPILVAPLGGNVGIRVSPTDLSTQSGLIPVTLQVGTGGTIGVQKSTSILTPPSGYSSIGPKTNEDWYIKDSTGVDRQIAHSGNTARRNRLINGSMRVKQRATVGATDNSYGIDGCRLLLESTTCAAITQGTAALMTGSSHNSAILTVGATGNAKFAVFLPILGSDMWDIRGTTASIQATIQVSNTRIGTVKFAILQFSGTENSISGDPISAWNGTGTNPTLAASWAYVNTPTDTTSGSLTMAATTAAAYKVEGVSVSATAVNLAAMVWNDDVTVNSGDTLSVTDIQVEKGLACTNVERRPYSDEVDTCQWWYEELGGDAAFQSFAPGYNLSTNSWTATVRWMHQKRTNPTVTFSGNFAVLDTTGGVVAVTTGPTVAHVHTYGTNLNGNVASGVTAGNGTILLANNSTATRITASAEL